MKAITLIGCGKAKREEAAPARDLYTGNLFRARLRYAAWKGDPYYIISARHGLLEPWRVIEPYDLHLSGVAREQRYLWASQVMEALERLHPGERLTLETHAGAVYVDHLRDRLGRLATYPEGSGAAATWNITHPVEGMPIGQQLGWYARRRPVQTDLEAWVQGAAR
ncbi:MAG: hypothetical protein CMH57_02545 [Myxococcales bacterium]|nr:hypothetical protein [Myxococcales bacterium]